MNSTSVLPFILPVNIAAGVGLADRREICGLLALLDASGTVEILKGLAVAVQEKLRTSPTNDDSQVARIAKDLFDSLASTDALRIRLWFEITRALDLPDTLPLSMRTVRNDAAAIAVRSAGILRPSVIAARRAAEEVDTNLVSKVGRRLRQTASKLRSGPSDEVSFSDVVAAEFKSLVDGLSRANPEDTFDSEIAAAIRKGEIAMSAAAVAGGGWVAFASAVGSAGFAPYIAAAKFSAVLPFVSGPALVSLLAVMINPVTVIAGTAALGYWATKGQSTSVRRIAAARIAVLLAVSGTRDPEGGIASLVTVFRRSHRVPKDELGDLGKRRYCALIERAERIELRLRSEVHAAVSSAPGIWGHPLRSGSPDNAVDASLVGALTVGDMLYHAAAVDPAVLAAADFSRAFSIDDPFELARCVGAFSSFGAQIGLRGYTAERLVMARLIEDGHVVEPAVNSTTPGFDLIVDGNPVQVKCGTSLSLLQEHFAKYPDIPVIADVDLTRMAEAAGLPWANMVATVEGFSLEYVQSIVDRSLDAAESLGESVVPVYAMFVGGARAARKAWKGEIPVEELPAWMVLDLSIRGGLASAGQIGGTFIGLLVIGPAGAFVLGPVTGIAALFGTRQLHDLLDRAIRTDWHADVIEAAQDLRRALVKALDRQLDLLLERQSRVRLHKGTVPDDLMTWLDRRMMDDVIFAWECLDDLEDALTLRDAMMLMIRASAPGMVSKDVVSARGRLMALLEAKPSTLDAIVNGGQRLKSLAEEKFQGR
mgnify:CR=1 FL=1